MFLFASLDDDGVVQASSGSAVTYIAAQGYDGVNPVVTEDAVADTDSFVGGFRHTSGGVLRIYDATAGLPLKYTYNHGVAMTTSGQACVQTAPFDDEDVAYLNGVALTADGRIYMSIT